jgi:hypothetical protein
LSLVRIGVSAVVLLVIVGCTSPSSEATPGSTPVPGRGQAAAIGCGNDVDLFFPDGKEIDLTSLWTSPDVPDVALWNVRQVGDCFFMVSRHFPDEEDNDYYDQICDGHIRTDFQITGRCVDFIHRVGPGIDGEADLQPQVFLILVDGPNEVRLQRCPASRAPGSCEVPMIRFDPENLPAESASPS